LIFCYKLLLNVQKNSYLSWLSYTGIKRLHAIKNSVYIKRELRQVHSKDKV